MTGNDVKEKAKNIIQKMRPMDYMILGAVIFIVIITGIIYGGKNIYSPSPVENSGKVAYDIYFQNVKISCNDDAECTNPFTVGEETFITIRNQPHAKLVIKAVKYNRKKVMMPTGKVGNPYDLVDDRENPLSYDFLVTVEDNGKFTSDGVVSGGSKIKTGLPIILEAPTYRFNGIISDIKVTTDSDIKDDGENKEVG